MKILTIFFCAKTLRNVRSTEKIFVARLSVCEDQNLKIAPRALKLGDSLMNLLFFDKLPSTNMSLSVEI